MLACCALAGEVSGRERVLLLHSYHPGYPWTDGATAGVTAFLRPGDRVDLFVEYMDSKRWSDPKHFDNLRTLLAHKYAPPKGPRFHLDAIICSDDHALDFLLAYRDELFPGVPVIFFGINDFLPGRIQGHRGITGVVEEYDFLGTLHLMLRLHPKTRQVVVVGDETKSGEAGLRRLRRAAGELEAQVRFVYLVGLSTTSLSEQLQALPEDSLVLYVTYLRTGEGDVLTLDQSRQFVTSRSPVPVYVPWDFFSGQGVLGGRGLSARSQGEAAAKLALRILDGEAVDSIPVQLKPPNPYIFDFAAMERFGVSEGDLPEESIVVGRPDSFYQRYGVWLWAVGVFVLLQSALIVFLIVLRLQRRRLEERLMQAHRMEAIGRLAGGVAHDFRNQLTVISGYCDILGERLEDGTPEHARLQQIRRAALRSTKLTSQLLAFSRKETLRPRIIDVNRLLAELLPSLGALIGEDVDLRFEPNVSLDYARLDSVQLEQALMNMATNARDAMPDGGRLTVSTYNHTFAAHELPDGVDATPGPYVCIVVEDTGEGMAPETLSQVFEPFFTTKGVGQGTGLGLSMVYGFARQSGGFVRATSEVGRGTKVTLCFPAAEGLPETTEQSQELEHPLTGRETVLVVEDDEAVLELVVDSLTSLEYDVLHTSDPRHAPELLAEHPGKVDLLITDVVMPAQYGPDLARSVKARFPHLRVVYMSGYTRDSFKHHGGLPPDAELLVKPFSREDLARTVRRVLDDRSTAPAGRMPSGGTH